MIRLYTEQALSANHIYPLIDEYHYLAHVHRIKLGDKILYFNNEHEYECNIVQITKKQIMIESKKLLRTYSSEPFYRLIVCNIKSARLKLLIEKAVEIGVSEIIITRSQRSQPYELSVDKLQLVAKQALQQSYNMQMPAIKYKSWKEVLSENYNICILSPDGQHISQIPPCDTLLVGPEGGFTDDELTLNYPKLSLSNSILRAETAAILGLHTLKYNTR